MSTVAIHVFHHLAMILKTNDTSSLWANLGNPQSLWARFCHSRQCGGCWLTLRPLPPTCFPYSDLLFFIASGLYTHMGLLWLAASSVPLSIIPHSKWRWNQISSHNRRADRWMVAAWGPELSLLSLPAFLLLPPAWATQSQAWLYRLNTHKKLFCLTIHFPNGALSHGVNWL